MCVHTYTYRHKVYTKKNVTYVHITIYVRMHVKKAHSSFLNSKAYYNTLYILYDRDQKSLQAIHDTSVTDHSQEHDSETHESVMTNQVVNM